MDIKTLARWWGKSMYEIQEIKQSSPARLRTNFIQHSCAHLFFPLPLHGEYGINQPLTVISLADFQIQSAGALNYSMAKLLKQHLGPDRRLVLSRKTELVWPAKLLLMMLLFQRECYIPGRVLQAAWNGFEGWFLSSQVQTDVQS